MSGFRMILKKIPGVSLCANIYRGFVFLKRAFALRKKLTEIDLKMPFGGPVGPLGYDMFCLSDKVVKSLKKVAVNNGVNATEKYFSVYLTAAEKVAVKELFDNIGPRIRAYLGKDVCLDGMNWMVSNKNYNSVSENWHTDNVGSRLKVFVCVSGDQSQPTLVIPSSKRIPGKKEWFFSTFTEAKRWFGYKNHKNIDGEFKLEHKTGTVYIFDTQLLHRGGYSEATSERIILNIEFSLPCKHKIARGPIGTSEMNSFKCSKSLTAIESFSDLLDPNRVRNSNGYFFYKN
ncbi:hypothetical protein N8Z70_02560 [Candidatus Puniceispirillum sp.]|nr:hypothetical protein [Candidatus Puniceispirillum sp.]